MTPINGRQLAAQIEDEIARQVFALRADGDVRRPSLAIIKIGDRADSALYVRIKERQAKSVGIDTNLYLFNEQSDEQEIIAALEFLNKDEATDGILVQLPLPEHLNTDKIIAAINPTKDIDGFHQANLAKLGDDDAIIPPVYGSITACLTDINFSLTGKQTVVIGNSDVFTGQLDKYLASLGAIVRTFTADNDWAEAAKQADLIISAVGQAKLINSGHVKPNVVIIDIGISQINGRTVGDVDSESLVDLPGYLTPTPGGIGPMTVALALKNTLTAYKHKMTA